MSMKRLFSDVSYKKVSEASLRYLIEERGFKIMHTQNVNSAKFLEAMKLWESNKSDLDPRKVAYGWKNERGLSVQEAMTAQESGHWLVISRPHIGKAFVLDQDDSKFKQGLKRGERIDRQSPMPKDVCEERSGIGTYLGHYSTPHGYHHILTEADDKELAGNGGWKIGEFEGDIRCDRGYAVMYDGDALADILRSADPEAPKTCIKSLLRVEDDKESEDESTEDDSGDETAEHRGPCPSIEEIGTSLNLFRAAGGGMSGPCFKCGEGETRFHVDIKDGKPLFFCFKQGDGEEACNGVNDSQTIAKMMEAINNRGDGAAAIAKAHRLARKAQPPEVCGAELAEMLGKFEDLTDYQRKFIDWKFWSEWHPKAMLDAQIKREKDELNAKHKELLNDNRRFKKESEEKLALRKAEKDALRKKYIVEQVETPFETGDINAFEWCLEHMGVEFRYNIIKMRVEYRKEDGKWSIPEDHHIDEMFMDIAKRYTWETDKGKPKPVHFGRGDQMTAYKGTVYRDQYNPWQEYIDNLPQWDGIERIHKSMDMGGMTIQQSPISAWAQGVAWVDLIRNGLYPGSPRFPEAVLFGPGGRGKSSFLGSMLPSDMRDAYFLEGGPPLDADDKTHIEQSAYLLIEGKEFGGGGKKDWEKVKETWDKRTYTARLAYGRTTSTHRRCDTRLHTTNRRQLPEDDTAVSRRLLAVKVTGKVRIENRRGFQPWDWFDSYVDEDAKEKGTYRDQMFAEAKAIISFHGGAHLEDGRWICSFNYLAYCAPMIANDPKALLEINQEAGVAYATEEGSTRIACKDALAWYKAVGVSSGTLALGERAGGVYDDTGGLVAIKPRGLYSMMYQIQNGHDADSAAQLTAGLVEDGIAEGGSANAVDRESGLTLALKRKFKGVATGGDEPLFKEDKNPTTIDSDRSARRLRWLRPA